MFKVTFPIDVKSKNRNKAIETAFEIGGTLNDKLVVVELNELELFKAYDRLLPLVAIIGNWKGFKGYYNDVPVNPYRFLLKSHFVFECAKESYTENAGKCCIVCRQKHLAAHVCPFHPVNNTDKIGVFMSELKLPGQIIGLN